jgi:Leu/Phe-tRNA-protein transferase
MVKRMRNKGFEISIEDHVNPVVETCIKTNNLESITKVIESLGYYELPYSTICTLIKACAANN